jgi:hypothetical protein
MAIVRGGGNGGRPGPGDIVQFGRPRPLRRGLATFVLVCLVVAAVVLVVARSSGPSRPPAPPATTVTYFGHPILGVQADWMLFGLDGNGVVTVRFDIGRIVRTIVPPLATNGPVFFVAAQGEAIIRPLDNVPGYVVPDGQPARQLTGVLAHGGTLLPGPTPTEQWFGRKSLQLLGPGGTVLNARLPATARIWSGFWVVADGAGGVVLVDMPKQVGAAPLVAGVEEYDAGPGMLRPVSAQLVAVGPKTWLGVNCQRGPCRNVVIAAATGASKTLAGPPVSSTPSSSQLGAVAPDGGTAAVIVPGSGERSTLELVSLVTGRFTRTAVAVGGSWPTQLAWSPDSRWLFVITSLGTLEAVDSRTGRAQAVGLGLSGLTQIVIRPAGG